MSARHLIRLAALVLTALLLVTAGLYVLVYLYRWEWNRAIVSGMFFLAALVTFSTVLILRRLRALEERLADIERTRLRARTVVSEENDERATRHFEWLRRPPEGLQVFIPVLLGAGVLLSFVAFAVERIAGTIAGPTVDRRTARLLAPDLPLGVDAAESARPRGSPTRESVWRPRIRLGAVVVGAAIFIGLGVDAIGDATQSRPEIPAFAGRTTIDLEIDQRRDARPPDEVASSLWVACRGRVPPEVGLARAVETGPETAQLVLDHQLGDLHSRRLAGCLEDLTLPSVIADVESIEMHDPGR